MPKFVHIDIAADEPERAAEFYEKVFGWTSRKLDGPVPYWLVSPPDDPSALGAGIAKREQAWQSTTPTIEVSSADEYGARIVAEGGTIIRPKALIPGVGYLLTFRDTEGNAFAILEPAADNRFAPPAG
ncbi:VOC family protein [Hoeflea sp.]|uniref:VOC family protein n=1 Tax=Hoeflea sp. TaxID=1940281 RepID=UPI0019AD207D|nr:VOC family protein [Hoeflea sp.]MBC7284295.1 VOC family protein [Hoeflea sp.]